MYTLNGPIVFVTIIQNILITHDSLSIYKVLLFIIRITYLMVVMSAHVKQFHQDKLFLRVFTLN